MRCWARYVSLCSIYFICQKSGHRFLLIFCQLLRILFSLKLWNEKWGSPCSFKRKRAFILLSSLVWGKRLKFCTRTRLCTRANDAKIVLSRDAQCNTKELINVIKSSFFSSFYDALCIFFLLGPPRINVTTVIPSVTSGEWIILPQYLFINLNRVAYRKVFSQYFSYSKYQLSA